MKLVATTIMLLFILVSNGTSQSTPGENSQTIKIVRSGSQQPGQGPAEHFTGSVQVEPLFPANAPSRTAGGTRHFRTRGSKRMAYASAGSNFDRYGWQGLGSAMGRSGRGNSAR